MQFSDTNKASPVVYRVDSVQKMCHTAVDGAALLPVMLSQPDYLEGSRMEPDVLNEPYLVNSQRTACGGSK